MGKAPFERILSLVERRRLFNKKLIDGSNMACRFADGKMANFKPTSILGGTHLVGELDHRVSHGAKSKSVTVMFYLEQERYFLRTRLARAEEGWVLQNGTEFYRLNRRETYRVSVPANIKLNMNVLAVNRKPCQVTARVVDFSSGGAKIRWAGTPGLEKGQILKAQLLWFRGRILPIVAEVRYEAGAGAFGLQFIELDSVLVSRLKMMSVELQQLVNFS